jgi:hypothetical protein
MSVRNRHASNDPHLEIRVPLPRVMEEIDSVYTRLKIEIGTQEVVKCFPSSGGKYCSPELEHLHKHNAILNVK